MSRSVACIIEKDGKLFIAKRNPTGAMGNRWEFPGGKIDFGETPFQAIIREMKEEFSVEAIPKEKIASVSFLHNEKKCSVTAFAVQFTEDGLSRKFILTEHSEYKWVLPEEIPSLDFVDSDLKLYPYVLEYLKK